MKKVYAFDGGTLPPGTGKPFDPSRFVAWIDVFVPVRPNDYVFPLGPDRTPDGIKINYLLLSVPESSR